MTRYKIVVSLRAERDLAEIYDYVAERSGDGRADNFVRAILADCRGLEVISAAGRETRRHPAGSAGQELRPTGRHRILNRKRPSPRDHPWRLYGGRDVARLLREEQS